VKLTIRPDMTVDSRTIAEGCGIQHKNALELLSQHLPVIEAEIGRVAFKTEPFKTNGGTQRQRVAFLTEDQATALVTMFRNTPVVVRFKVALAKAFGIAKRAKRPSYGDLARMVLAQEETVEAHREVLSSLMPVHPYGSLTKDGCPRIGMRRAAFVKQLHKISEAAAIQRQCAQIELNLMLEEAQP